MKTQVSFATLLLLNKVSASGDSEFGYDSNGADWPEAFPDCALTNQSPIDLSSGEGEYPSFDWQEDSFMKSYENQYDVTVKWVGDTSKVVLDEGTDNMFTSDLAETWFGANKQFNAAQFHFHSGSEHTIDGQRFDLEMHTVHLAEDTINNFGYAALGIIFSVNDYTADCNDEEMQIIEDFFASINFDDLNDPTPDMINYGDLIDMVDTNNRYVYKGSVTTPPCGQSVYWNVLSKVYPVSQATVDAFKNQMGTLGVEGLKQTGNWREIQEVDMHDVIKVTADDDMDWTILDSVYEDITGETMDSDTKEKIANGWDTAEGFYNENMGEGASQIIMGLVSSASVVAMTLF